MRPVLITSLTVIAAMMPAAIGLGPGVESNRPQDIAEAIARISEQKVMGSGHLPPGDTPSSVTASLGRAAA